MHNSCRGGIFSSCQKNEQPEIVESYTTNCDNPNLSKEIKSFRDNMIGTHKSGSNMQLKDAVWMMEATFNYYHSFVHEDALETQTDTIIIPVNYNGFDEIDFAELSDIFKTVNNAIYQSYTNYQAENKVAYLFDLELEATTTGSQIAIYCTNATVNTQKAGNVINTNPFGSTDYWWLAGRLGKCGIYDGEVEYDGRDAGTEWRRCIKRKYNPSSKLYTFINITTLYTTIYPTDYPSSNPYHEDYMLPYGDISGCMTPDMMNYYYHNIEYIVEDINITGKDLADVTLFAQRIENNYPFYYNTFIHNPKYGDLTFRTFDEVPFSLSLIK